MKYTINGYSQEKLLKNNLDLSDSLILRILADIYSSNGKKIEYKIINNDKYMWISYGYLFEQIPILGSERTLVRKIDNLIAKKMLKKELVTSKKGIKGRFLYISFGERYFELTEYSNNTKIFTRNLISNSNNIDECLDYYVNSMLNLNDSELKLELVMTSLKRNYEVFNEENFNKLKNIACNMIDFVKESLNKYKKAIKIREKDFEKCSKMIFTTAQVFLMMENINFETNKFSSKTLDEVKELYRSQEMKENLEFIKESIKKILYR